MSLLFEKISNRALKKVRALWTPPLGKIGLIKNKGIHPDSLIPTYKEALDLCMKESVVSDSDVDSDDL